MKPTTSIIIVVKNDRGIERTLELLQAQQGAGVFEIIVIDASTPGTLADLWERFSEVRWEQFDQQGKRFTIPEQRNRGLELARGEVIALIDANCVPGPDWLAKLLAAIRDGEDVVCGPCRASNANNLVTYFQEHEQRTYVPECTTVNVALRRPVFEVVGLFDTNLSYGEDVDFFWRVTDAGYRLCFEPQAPVTHDFGATEEQMRRAYRYGRARAGLHLKHWRRRWRQLLLGEPHVWMYPVFILSTPLALLWPPYLLILLVPTLKNRSVTVTLHHLIYGWGVLAGLATRRGV